MTPTSRPARVLRLQSLLEELLAIEYLGPDSLSYSAPTWRYQVNHLLEWAQQLDAHTRDDADKFEASFTTVKSRLLDAADDGWEFLSANVRALADDVRADVATTLSVGAGLVGVLVVLWIFFQTRAS